jgi:hypothetical protein
MRDLQMKSKLEVKEEKNEPIKEEKSNPETRKS